MDSNKFSYQALQIMSLAQQEARRLRRKFVGTEELLVALCNPDSAVHKLLLEFNIVEERLRAVLIPDGEKIDNLTDYFVTNSEKLPFSANAEIALEQALDAAGGGKADVQHIMWGLLSEDTAATKLLLALRIDLKKLESEVFGMLDFKDAKASEEDQREDSGKVSGKDPREAQKKDSPEAPIIPSKQAPPPRPAGSLKDKYRDKQRKDIDHEQCTPSNQAIAFEPRPATVSSWFATQAQSAMSRAFDESEALGSILGTEHILYGLVCDGTECTTRTFEYTKVNADSVRKQIRSFKASKAMEEGQTLHTNAVTLLEQSRNVMSQCGHEMIDCEHLLIAMIHNSDTIAYTILQNLGVDTRVLKEVLLFWMNRCGAMPGSRSVIGRIEYARTKELKSEDPQ